MAPRAVAPRRWVGQPPDLATTSLEAAAPRWVGLSTASEEASSKLLLIHEVSPLLKVPSCLTRSLGWTVPAESDALVSKSPPDFPTPQRQSSHQHPNRSRQPPLLPPHRDRHLHLPTRASKNERNSQLCANRAQRSSDAPRTQSHLPELFPRTPTGSNCRSSPRPTAPVHARVHTYLQELKLPHHDLTINIIYLQYSHDDSLVSETPRQPQATYYSTCTSNSVLRPFHFLILVSETPQQPNLLLNVHLQSAQECARAMTSPHAMHQNMPALTELDSGAPQCFRKVLLPALDRANVGPNRVDNATQPT